MEKDNEETIIPSYLLEIPKNFVSVSIPYCEKNENISKNFIKKLHEFNENSTNLTEMLILYVLNGLQERLKVFSV